MVSLISAKMQLPRVWKWLVFALLISDICFGFEVMNEATDVTEDLNLRDENLLPVDLGAVKINKARQRSLSSVNENTQNKDGGHDLLVETESPRVNHRSTATPQVNDKHNVKTMTPQPSDRQSSSSNTNDGEDNDIEVDLAREGLITVDKKQDRLSPNRRKVAQFSQDKNDAVDEDLSQRRRVQKMNLDKGAMLESLKVACNDDTWECLMFKEDLLAMQASDVNLSRRASVVERSKRQAASSLKTAEVSSDWYSRNLLGCEGEECFSGNGTNTEEEIAPEFRFKSKTKTKTNLTNDDLNNATKRQDLATELQQELTKCFSNIPGLKEVYVNPNRIFVDDDGNLVFDDWNVTIDGGNGEYTGNTGAEVGKKVQDAIEKAKAQCNNITVGGQSPISQINVKAAVDEVIKQANNPCNIKPDPCSFGYGDCERLPADFTKNNGFRLKCYDTCFKYEDCHNGTCKKDMAGKAYCNCTQGYTGLYCDREDKPTSNKDETKIPEYRIEQTSVFPTSLNQSDLTPEVRQKLANDLKNLLTPVLSGFPGFKGIDIDPNSISIVDGKLIIPWDIVITPSAYTGLTPEEIADLVWAQLKNVSDAYRNNVVIDGQRPYDGLDFENAAEQVEEQARNPCIIHQCSVGYSHCQALSSTQVRCISECNVRPECPKNGTCSIDSNGNAVCSCSDGNCERIDRKSEFDSGQIAGIVLGSGLVLGGVLGVCLSYLFCGRYNQRDISFTHYTDQEGSGQFSDASSKMYVIDRPAVSATPMPLYTNSANYSAPPSQGDSSGSGRGGNPVTDA